MTELVNSDKLFFSSQNFYAVIIFDMITINILSCDNI